MHTLPLRLFAALMAALLWAAPLAAQDDAPSETSGEEDEARAAFMAGQEAAGAGRWSDSLNEFQRSYLLSGSPTALYNAAMALRALGRHREARDAFDRVITAHADSPAAAQSVEKRDEEAARVAMLVLAGLDPESDYEIRLDGRVVDAVIAAETQVEADPGRRGLVAEREGYEPWTWEGDITDGQTLRLTVEMDEVPTESRSVLKSPVFWIITGAVLVGAGVGLGIFLQNNAQLDTTYGDNTLGV